MKSPTKPRAPSPSRVDDIAPRWLAESFRVTLFFASPIAKSSDLWQRIGGAAPDTVTERPAQGIHQSIGPFGKGILTANQLPGRIDIIYAPKSPDDADLVKSPFVDIGPYAEAEKIFCQKVLPAVGIFDNVIRIGYAPIVLIDDDNIVASNAVLSRYMTELTIDVDHDSDIALQINKPTLLTSIDGVRLNRIFRWQVAEMQLIQVANLGSLPSKLSSRSMCRLDLDLSSDAKNRNVIPAGKISDVISEMQSEARRFIVSGEK